MKTWFGIAKTVGLAFILAACGTSEANGGAGGAGGSGGGAGTGGSTGVGGSSDSDAGGTVCQKQSDTTTADGVAVISCEEGFGDAPFVRPPADTDSVVFGALDPMAKKLVTRTAPLDLDATAITSISKEVGNMGAPQGDRYAYAIYKATLGANQQVDTLVPAIMVDDAVFMQAYLTGIDLEGTISKQTSTDGGGATFDLTPSLPVHIKTTTDLQPMPPTGTRVFPTVNMTATVSNATAAVLGADGSTCLPSLASAGDQNPFKAVTGDVQLVFSRVPDMHGNFDNELVVAWPMQVGGTDMGVGLYISPAQLIAPSTPTQYEAFPHGNPTSSPSVKLDIVKGGGQACTP
jgi:hypothetical protein